MKFQMNEGIVPENLKKILKKTLHRECNLSTFPSQILVQIDQMSKFHH